MEKNISYFSVNGNVDLEVIPSKRSQKYDDLTTGQQVTRAYMTFE